MLYCLVQHWPDHKGRTGGCDEAGLGKGSSRGKARDGRNVGKGQVIDVFFGESRTYIKDTLMHKLGWKKGDRLDWYLPAVGVYRVLQKHPKSARPEGCFPLRERDGKYCFGLTIPGVSRGRLNGARGVVGQVENGVLVIDVRKLLAPDNS